MIRVKSEPTQTIKAEGSWEESVAWKAGYTTIAEIAKERVRRVIKKLDENDRNKLPLQNTGKLDRGFKVSNLAESNFKLWDANVAKMRYCYS